MKRPVKLAIGLVALLAILVLPATWYVHHYRPLISSSEWTASIKVEGRDPIAGEVFHLLGRPKSIFIRFPAPLPEDSRGYPWFSADTSEKFVAIPNWPRTTLYLHFNHDMAIGVGITDGKVDDDWHAEWTDAGFSFHNPKRSITVSRSN